ncbi:DUF2913 family protein [Salmonella enterica subsp. enterica serovar Eastbourne]|nr:DUF2913 family protein [Salmonella enterica subsp. enterica serovar Eastbourne]
MLIAIFYRSTGCAGLRRHLPAELHSAFSGAFYALRVSPLIRIIALRLARLDGRVQSEQQENLFLVRWFADAERQRRFSRDVATDIRWMLQQGRSLGVRAQLARKLDYIWRSTTGNIMEQTELFRLTWGLETAKSQQWGYHVLSDTEWLRLCRQSLNPDICAVYIPKSLCLLTII